MDPFGLVACEQGYKKDAPLTSDEGSTTHETVMRHRYSDARLVVPITTSIASPPSWIVRGKASKHSFGEQAMTAHSPIWRESMELTLLLQFFGEGDNIDKLATVFVCQTEANSKESFKS
ncbi:MAG: hypothetical protein IPM54_24320 [Polyangiaceae bacterium]|nr:hypothetical protein [Polyangiaceae bacterium]